MAFTGSQAGDVAPDMMSEHGSVIAPVHSLPWESADLKGRRLLLYVVVITLQHEPHCHGQGNSALNHFGLSVRAPLLPYCQG